MSLLVRLIGCIMVIVSFGIAGIKKAQSFNTRVKSIEQFMLFITKVGEQIRLSENEIPEILANTLPNGVLVQEENVVFDKSYCLSENDKKIISEFIGEVGMGDASSQYRRCSIYKQFLEEKRKEALTETYEKNRLYSMGGWMVGLALSFLWW